MKYEKYVKHVPGKRKGDVFLFALSTCGWCKKTKRLLNELGVDYSYVDVDLLEGEAMTEAEEEIERWNPSQSFPILVINNAECILGYREEEIREKLGSGEN